MSYSGGKQQPQIVRHHQRNHPQRYIQQGYQYDNKLEYGPNGAADGRGGPQQHQHHPQHLHQHQHQHQQQHQQQPGRYGVPPGRGYGPPPGPESQVAAYHPAMMHPQHYRHPTPDVSKPGVELVGMPAGPVYPGQQPPPPQPHHQAPLQRPAVHPGGYGGRRPGPAVMGPRPPAPYPGHGPSLPPPPPVSYTAAAGPPASPQQGGVMLIDFVQGGSPANPGAPVQMRQPYMTQSLYQPQPTFSLPHQPQQGVYGQPMWRPPQQLQQPPLPPQLLDQQLALQRSQQLEALAEQQQQQQRSLPPMVVAVPPAPPPPQPPHHSHQSVAHSRSNRIPIINPATGLEVSPSLASASEGPGPGEPAWRPPGSMLLVTGGAGGDGPWHPSPGSGIPGRRQRLHSSASTSELGELERPSRPPGPRQRASASTSELEPPLARPHHGETVVGIPGVARPVGVPSPLSMVPAPPPPPPAPALPVATVMPVPASLPPGLTQQQQPLSVTTAVGEFELVSAAEAHGDAAPVVTPAAAAAVSVAEEPSAAAVEIPAPAPQPPQPTAAGSGVAAEAPPTATAEPQLLVKSEPEPAPVAPEEPRAGAIPCSVSVVVPTRPVAVVEPLVPELPAEEPASPPAEKLGRPGELVEKSADVVPAVEPATVDASAVSDALEFGPEVVPASEQEFSSAPEASPATSPELVSDAGSHSLPLPPPTADAPVTSDPATPDEDDWTTAASRAAVTTGAAPPAPVIAESVPTPPVTAGSAPPSPPVTAGSAAPPLPVTAGSAAPPAPPAPPVIAESAPPPPVIAESAPPPPVTADDQPDRAGDSPESCSELVSPDADSGSAVQAAAVPEEAPPVPEEAAPVPEDGDEDSAAEAAAGAPLQPPQDAAKVGVLSTHGKMQYCREELLRLQHAPLSQRRPETLPDLPSVVRRAGPPDPRHAAANLAAFKARAGPGPPEFASGFKPAMMGPPGKYRGRSSGPAGGPGLGPGPGPGGRPMAPMAGMPRRIEISLNRDVKLRTSENAWKPGAAASSEQLDPTEKVVRSLKGILNKLTPSNLERQIENMKQLELNTPALLAAMIDVLFEKAVVEPTYATQYAAVCLAMAKTEVESEGDSDGKNKVTFQRLLLQQCQREFEKDKSSELNREERLKEIAQLTDESARRLQNHLLSQEARKMRYRSNGNIRFIGELYKLGMLTDRIMHQCIGKLLREKHEDSYECLCKLVSTIGEKLERSGKTGNENLDQVFVDLKKLVRDKSISSRIRFMVLDLIELRANSWVDLRTAGKTKPQTIDEVHKQAAQDHVAQQAALAHQLDRRGGERRGGRPPAPRSLGPDGWNTVGSRAHFDPGRMMTAVRAGASPPPPGAQFKLGPVGVGGWSQGSRGSRPSPSVSPALGNRFAALRGDRGPSSRGSSGERSGSRSGSRPGSRASSAERPAAPAAAAAAPAAGGGPASRLTGPANASAEDMRRQARTIVSEFMEIGDDEEAIQDCETHLHETTVVRFVAQGLDAFVDARSAAERAAVGRLHALLLERGLLAPAQYLTALESLLEAAPDLAPDVPAVWQNLAQMVEPVLLAGRVSLHGLACAAEEFTASGGGHRLLVALLSRLRLAGEDRLKQVAPPDTEWSRFLGSEDCSVVLEEAGLGFLLPPGPVDLPVDRAPEEDGLRALLDAIRGDAPLAAWLERKVSPEARRTAQYTGDLTAAIGFHCLVIERGVVTARPERVELFADVLRAQLDSPERQADAAAGLARITAHVAAHPGALEQLLRQLQRLQLLSVAALRCWRDQRRRLQLPEPPALQTLLAAADA